MSIKLLEFAISAIKSEDYDLAQVFIQDYITYSMMKPIEGTCKCKDHLR